MSVLIRGMEMPTSCYDCPVECEGDVCGITQGGCTWDAKPPHCPLIELHPHGRLIDADEFYKDVNESILLTDAFKHAFNFWFDGQQTIIPAEEEGE